MEVDSLNWVNIHLKHARYRNSVAQWLRRCATNQKAAGSILRKIPARIPNEWLLRPQFYLWPPQRQRAVLWVLSRFVTFRLHRQRGPTFRDLMDFLRRSRWKIVSVDEQALECREFPHSTRQHMTGCDYIARRYRTIWMADHMMWCQGVRASWMLYVRWSNLLFTNQLYLVLLTSAIWGAIGRARYR